MRKYIIISDDFTLKGSKTQQVLTSLRQYNKFALDKEQFEFLKLCDGRRTEKDLMNLYCPDDHATIQSFLKLLENMGAIKFLESSKYRDVSPDLVPDLRLQAVHFEITGGCNMRCVHCYQGDIHNIEKDLSLKEIEKLILQMKKLQVEHVNIGGGEPLTRPDLFEIIGIIEANDMRVSSLFTNGLLVSEEVIERFLKCRSIFTVYNSLDAITGDGMSFRGFDKSHGDRALRNIIAHIKNMTSRGFPVVVNTLLTKHTISYLREMYDVMRDLNVTSWRLGFPKNVGAFVFDKHSFKESWQNSSQACLDILRHHLDQGEPFHMQIEYLYRRDLFENMQLLSDDEYVCDYEGRREGCCIRPNSDVVSCAYGIDFPLGNVRNQSLESIWYSEKMRKIKNMRIGDVKGCKDCLLRPICATGCRVNAHFLGDDMYNGKDHDACMAVEFFTAKIVPLLLEKGVLLETSKVIPYGYRP